ncbi:TIGR02757 family protein [Pedobacter yulinensis]|uniref:TIGR02757 family protein n=1 Tax=Pedobacter yulinensis TaxID=2126353 RepID=A0A2T3HLH5_9SPHI|nr:TIGR02757 family protein [Pedobacter yulinensis]PST83284.1 TIGR02757 family protein [Pedobacter yulinensis]
MSQDLKAFLDAKADWYNRPEFIAADPVSIPHRFTKKQDIEIAGFFAAVLAWGQRKTIINKCLELMARMDDAPYDFITGHSDHDLKRLLGFKHRTFNDTDLLYFVAFFRAHYRRHSSLEAAFIPGMDTFNPAYLEAGFPGLPAAEAVSSPVCLQGALRFDLQDALDHFRRYFFSLPDFPDRTKKHVSAPSQKSTCKRLCMFLRWMVRADDRGVDFGIWKTLRPAQLICPCDVHVDRVARNLGLISRKQTDWLTAVELTAALRCFDPEDPVRYDFALFGLGVEGAI